MSEPPRPSPHMALVKFLAQVKTKSIDFFVTTNYKVIQQIGNGSYGVVCSATRTEDGKDDIVVAVKQIAMPATCEPRAPHPLSDFEIVASRTLREIRILKFLAEQLRSEGVVNMDNFIVVSDILQMRSKDVDTVYTVTQLMPSDLHAVLRNPQQSLGNDHVQHMMYNLLRALKYLHSAGIIHRDIKPQNVLVNDSSDVVLCDFGLARGNSDHYMTVYVETRWYRAPELIMGMDHYDERVDIWSLGCVMAEMLLPVGKRDPLWRGLHAKNQLDLIICTIGVPTSAALGNLGTSSARTYLDKMRLMDYVPKTSQLGLCFPPTTDPAAIDLLDKMLAFLPQDRMTAEQCLAHPYFAGHHDADDEPVCRKRYVDPALDFVYDIGMSSSVRSRRLKDMLYDEMITFHPELAGLDPSEVFTSEKDTLDDVTP